MGGARAVWQGSIRDRRSLAEAPGPARLPLAVCNFRPRAGLARWPLSSAGAGGVYSRTGPSAGVSRPIRCRSSPSIAVDRATCHSMRRSMCPEQIGETAMRPSVGRTDARKELEVSAGVHSRCLKTR